MTDPTQNPADPPVFETDEVATEMAIEQGLGVGARELAAQREPVTIDADESDDANDAGEGEAD